jgi:hypothetical protein
MSYSAISAADESLTAVVKDLLRLKDDEADRLVDAIKDLASAMADQEIDRLFNRGDFRG